MPAPAPVPALPDTARITSYSPSSSTGPFAVNYALYGDGTDYGAWLDVTLNEVELVAGVDYTLSSPSGPIATIPRPITDATISLTAPGTGLLAIVGQRRPRRLVQFAENRGVAARDFNQFITDMVANLREYWDFFRTRALITPPGDQIGMLPNSTARANSILSFDSLGNPIASIISFLGLFYMNQVNDGTVSSGTATINVSQGPWHRLTVGGAISIAFIAWPTAPAYAEVEIELINGGIGVTWPIVNWLNGLGQSGTSFSFNGVTLNASGTNWVLVWSRDGGVTLWGRAA